MKNNVIEPVESIKERFEAPKNVNEIHKKQLSALENLAVFVTERIGTMGFFFIIFGWTFIWMVWNIIAPRDFRFDPFPAFVLWLFISNLIQIHLMPLIMIGQNIQGRHAELRATNEYKTSLKSEKEIETILLHLEKQEKLLEEISKKLK